jgi:hypothetical protein
MIFLKMPWSPLKGCADVAAAGPDHVARLDVFEIVQCKLEGRRNNIAITHLKSDAGIADIAQRTGEYTALPIREEQGSARRLQPVNLPSFNHRCLRMDEKRRWQKRKPDAAYCFVRREQ